MTSYERRRIAERYGDWLADHGRGVTPLFLSLFELGRQLESKSRKAARNKNSHPEDRSNEALSLHLDAEACVEEARRLRDAAGIPMKHGWSTQGNVSGRDEHGKPETPTVGRAESADAPGNGGHISGS